MTVEQIIGLSLALVIMLVGCLGSFLPIIPGTPLILITAIAHRLYFGPASVSNWVLLALVVFTAVSLALDYAASALGAKKLGATWRGMVGAAVGGLIGLFFSLPGIILGPFIGAILFELLGGYRFEQATRAGAGAMLGLLAGAIGKFGIAVAMVLLFAVVVIYRSLGSGPLPS